MPELPEVETIANGVNERVRGARIVAVWTSGKPQTFKSPEIEIEEVLTGARIERVRRVGKTVVVTHHLPSVLSVAERFIEEPLSACFASNLYYLFGQMDLWIHGLLASRLGIVITRKLT